MNLDRLKQAEEEFFYRYPGGFANPEIIRIRSKHQLEKMFEMAQVGFARRNFRHPDLIIENMVKVITRSSLVSMFEKPRFRNFAQSLLSGEKQRLAEGLEEFLFGNEQTGFETILEILKGGKLAKWSLMTICPAYYQPQLHVFVKPTTTKGIIQNFEIEALYYHPTPAWIFYHQYRTVLNEMKTKVDASLSPYNIAFTGFLKRSMHGRWL